MAVPHTFGVSTYDNSVTGTYCCVLILVTEYHTVYIVEYTRPDKLDYRQRVYTHQPDYVC